MHLRLSREPKVRGHSSPQSPAAPAPLSRGARPIRRQRRQYDPFAKRLKTRPCPASGSPRKGSSANAVRGRTSRNVSCLCRQKYVTWGNSLTFSEYIIQLKCISASHANRKCADIHPLSRLRRQLPFLGEPDLSAAKGGNMTHLPKDSKPGHALRQAPLDRGAPRMR